MSKNEAAISQTPGLSTDFKRPLRIGFCALIFLFGVIFAWFAFAPLASAVIANGSVIVRGRPQLVQHLDGGIVREICVSNGSVVKKGDLLVRLDDTLLLANLEIYRNRLREAKARKSRLEGERDNLAEIKFETASGPLFHLGEDEIHRDGQRKLFEARRMSREGQIEQLREKIAQSKNQVVGVEGLIAARREQLSYIEKELEGLRFLLSKGITSQTRVLTQEGARAELIGQLAEYHAERARIENSIRETEINILQVRRQFGESVLTELREVSTQVDDLIQQMIATTKQIERIDIRAPVSGIVHELNVNTIGGVIPAGGTLMQLISDQEGVEVEVNVETHLVDELHIGQEAVIRFPAFNQRTTPELFGKVGRISPSSVTDEKTGVSFYRVAIDVTAEQIERLGELKLVPGMPAEAHVRTEERTPLNYLLKPLLDQFNRAMREP